MTVTVVQAGRGNSEYWRDIWHFRELFLFLAWRDILVRYKQTAIGLTWAVLRPLLTMIIFTVVFGKLAGLSSGGAPYGLMVFAAMLPWQFFSLAFADASNSLISSSSMVSKVYFPRLIIPVSTIMVSLVDFLISFVLLVALMVWYGFPPSPRMLAIPVFTILMIITTLGPGLLIAALNVKYRDFRYIVPFIVQLGLYISPVGFSSNIVPDAWRLLYSINPMVGVIDGFRWAILGDEYPVNWQALAVSLVLAIGLLIFGLKVFRKTEQQFADLI